MPFPVHAAGAEEMKQLAQATVAALQEAEFIDELAMLESRVFSHPAEELFEAELDQQSYRWKFKPMLELLLLHMLDLAGNESRPIDARRQEVQWALSVAGY